LAEMRQDFFFNSILSAACHFLDSIALLNHT